MHPYLSSKAAAYRGQTLIKESLADTPQSTTKDACLACFGVVYLGRLVEKEHGEEAEVIEAVPYRRCGGSE
jgi:hypothetical protein